MSLSVERLKELRADAYDYGNTIAHMNAPTEFETGLLKIYRDTVQAYDELLALKEAKPVAYECDGVLTHAPYSHPGHVSIALIRKPE